MDQQSYLWMINFTQTSQTPPCCVEGLLGYRVLFPVTRRAWALTSCHLPFVIIYICRLNLRELGPLASHMRWFIWLMAAGGTIYVFLYHEK